MEPSLAVVVPTRNRPALARNAVRSTLACRGAAVRVLVSDNSTDPAHRADLRAFCQSLGDPRLTYVTPPQPLPMPAHWEFAVGHAEARFDASHFVILTDRMMFRSGMLGTVARLVAQRPEMVLSYNDDMVHDRDAPVRLERKPLTGRVLELESEQLLYLSAIGVFPQALPRMLNCVVPRAALEAVRRRFGDVFTSVAPDLCHAYRCMAVYDRIRYYDAPVMIQYGFAQSNGTGYYDKKTNDAWSDFNRNAGPRGLTFAAPVPEVCCNLNVVYHEYCFVRGQAGDPARFPAVDWKRYVHAIAQDIQSCGNADVRGRLFAQLKARAGDDLCGWVPPAEGAAAPPAPRSLWGGLRDAARAALGLPRGDGTFATSEAARAYADDTRPAFVPINDHVQYMQRGWKLAG